ncbi:MAG: 8-oxo-dGTP diphosphatase [Caldilineaceae bacterium]|nr:8-oxo-dGTP diphosphatase [Caldilineaceae bacterium]
MMKLATLCYVREGPARGTRREHGRTLMLHRIKKANDMHAGKWNGLGGKLEAGETPEECAIREVWEESGLRMIDPVLRGVITFPHFSKGEDWYTFVFVADQYSGELIDSNEGVLAWVDDDKLLDLNLWPGDRIFLRWLDDQRFFSAKFVYSAGELTKYEVVFYTQPSTQTGSGGTLIVRETVDFTLPVPDAGPHAVETAGAGSTAQRSENLGFQPVYTPEDDTYCWMCGAAVDKRHCKIICLSCGFTRDCSDP